MQTTHRLIAAGDAEWPAAPEHIHAAGRRHDELLWERILWMIAISRFRVPQERADEFAAQARAAIDALETADGFLTADLGRNLDDPALWTIATRWVNVGSYRRGLGSYQSKIAQAPLQPWAIDEPSAYGDADDLVL